jgi:hypothetical protein
MQTLYKVDFCPPTRLKAHIIPRKFLELGEQVSNSRVRVRLGIEHQASNSSRSNKEGSTNGYKSNSPRRQQGINVQESLLISVREGVVSGGHVGEGSSQVHLSQTSIEVWFSSIQFHAVLYISLDSVCVTVVLGQEFFVGKAVSLSEHGHSQSESLRLEQWSVVSNPVVISGLRVGQRVGLDDVGSVGLVSTFTSITSGVSITSSPLEVNVISNSGVQDGRSEIVFSGRESLDNVSSLSSNVNVKDTSSRRNTARSGSEVIGVRSILEGSSELGSIHSQLVNLTILGNKRILSNRGVSSIHSPVNESSVRSVGIGTQIGSGNVVSESENTVAVVLLDARFIVRSGHGNVDGVIETSITST